MIPIPTDRQKLISFALEMVDKCRSSTAVRASYCRQINALTETGRPDGVRSLMNMLYGHTDRLAAHLFSPTELRFSVDYENLYPPNVVSRAVEAARLLTREFERSNTDIMFGQAVSEATKYGASILKQWSQSETEEQTPVYYSRLVMPWQFGVWREDETNLSRQPVMCETSMLSLPEIWQRIWYLPEADKLFARIKANALRNQGGDADTSFFHEVLSTSVLQTNSLQNMTRPMPGGVVQIANDPNYSIMGPELSIETATFHELWVQGEKDYVTIQLIEPDVLICPRYKHANILFPGDIESMRHPYTLVQPNPVAGYIWGRPEITDLIAPQSMITGLANDMQRLMGIQFDKLLAFPGSDGITDEAYDQFRGAGYMALGSGTTVTDLTPKFPAEALPMFKMVLEMMNVISGFPAIMQGQGEQGVRAGSHANTLMKTGSPRLRDRALLVERQCAAAADLRLALMEAKDGRSYWTNGDTDAAREETSFLLSDLPEDRRVAVDSHSSSPIFADDHAQLIAFGAKLGWIDGEEGIEDLPFPNKDRKKQRYRKKQEAAAKQREELMKQIPQEEKGKAALKALTGGRHHG